MKKKIAITFLGWIISAILISSLFYKIDFETMWNSFKNASFVWIIAAALINLFVVIFKAARWRMIMGSDNISIWQAISATFLGFAGNNLLPARGGDWFRIYILGKWTNQTKAGLTAITLADKLLDGISAFGIFLFLLTYALLIEHNNQALPEWMTKSSLIVFGIIILSTGILLITFRHHKKISGNNFISNFGSGLKMLSKKHILTSSVLISVITSLLQIITILMCQLAFDVHIGMWGSALVFIAVNLAIIIPSAPSGIGPFETAAVITFSFLGLKTETAFNIALMYHAVQFIPVTIIGLYFYFRKFTVCTTMQTS